MRRTVWLVWLALLLLSGCGGNAASAAPGARERSFFAMDTYMSIRAGGATEALLARAEEAVLDLERRISVTDGDSQIFALNRDGAGTLDAETAELLRRGLALCAETDGALDLSVYPVLRAWGFTTGDYRVPAPAELADLLRLVDYRRVRLDADGTAALDPGMQLDLGSVAKGYLGDKLCALLRDGGVESALLDLGGNVQALGGKPDGSPWRVGIRDPQGEGLLGVLAVRDCAVVTSGGYERCFTDGDGTVYWHILDPASGMPARSGLLSVTVVGQEGLRCDALSTALFVMGPERAAAFWRAHGGFELALVTEDGRLLLTPGLAERFTPAEGLSLRVETLEREGAA